jgi:formate hydrogenlyase subunit 3/multisubunit Na+/H+ antiporter MnhD subunit
MAGIPLVAGFVSKYFLLIGTVSSGGIVFTVALLVSGVLNIAYFWPVVYTAFFESPGESDPKPVVENVLGGRYGAPEAPEAAADGGSSPEDRDHDGDGARDDHGYAPDHTGQGELDEEEAAAQIQHAHGHDPAPAWEHRAWNGSESTWFMLGPILFAATGSIVLGIVPDTAVFLRIVRLVVAGATGVSV